MTDLSAGPEIWAHKVNEPDTSGQYPDPEVIRQKRIAELGRKMARCDDLWNKRPFGWNDPFSENYEGEDMIEQRGAWKDKADHLRAELSRLRNEQPKGNERPKLRLEEDAQGKRAMLGGYQMPNELIPSLEAEAPSPLPEPQDVRERFARSLYFAAEGLGSQSWFLPENDAHWERWKNEGQDGIAPSPLAIADALIAAFPALAQSDAQPVGSLIKGPRCGISWGGSFYVEGNRESIEAVRTAHDAQLRCEALDKLITEKQLVRHTAPPRPDASGLIEAAGIVQEYRAEIGVVGINGRRQLKTYDPDIREEIVAEERGCKIACDRILEAIRTRAADRSAPRSDTGGA